jgi:hypothetical protein
VGDMPPAVLPTHRVVHGLSGARFLDSAASLFDVHRVATAGALLEEMSRVPALLGSGGSGRVGCWTRDGGAVLRARRESFEPFLDRDARPMVRWLDVTLLAVSFHRLLDLDAAALAAGGRLTYTQDASEAVALVDAGAGDACFLLDPTPLEAVMAVAAEGGSMPQKSTYFHPKAPAGLVFNPLES